MDQQMSQKSLPLVLSAKGRRTGEAPISFLIAAAMGNPKLINLAAGLVDPRTLPVEECAQITQRIFADPQRGRVALQYDTTLGLAGLRRQVLGHVEKLEGKSAAEMSVGVDDVLITTGSQQALYLIGDTLIDPGDIVIAANPSYFVYTGTLASLGARVVTVPMDNQGMRVDLVEQTLARLEREGLLGQVRFIYCTSYFQNPTGLTLSRERRPKLLEVAKKFSKDHRVLVLEDAAYRELRYDGAALPSIKSFDAENQFTVLTQTFSKPFAPGIKAGYTLMPGDLLRAVLHQKGNHDFGSANVSQQIALGAMEDGSYDRQVKKLCDGYRAKRDVMLKALRRYMPAGVSWTEPHGGLYVWVTLPTGMDSSRQGAMFEACLEAGVLYVPGDYCMQPDEHGVVAKNCLRLSFGQVDIERIEPGIERLAGVVTRQVEEKRAPAVAGRAS